MTQNEAPETLYFNGGRWNVTYGLTEFKSQVVGTPNIEYIRSDVAEARANAKAAAVLVIACATLLDRLTVYGTDNAYRVVRDVFDNIQLKEQQ